MKYEEPATTEVFQCSTAELSPNIIRKAGFEPTTTGLQCEVSVIYTIVKRIYREWTQSGIMVSGINEVSDHYATVKMFENRFVEKNHNRKVGSYRRFIFEWSNRSLHYYKRLVSHNDTVTPSTHGRRAKRNTQRKIKDSLFKTGVLPLDDNTRMCQMDSNHRSPFGVEVSVLYATVKIWKLAPPRGLEPQWTLWGPLG